MIRILFKYSKSLYPCLQKPKKSLGRQLPILTLRYSTTFAKVSKKVEFPDQYIERGQNQVAGQIMA